MAYIGRLPIDGTQFTALNASALTTGTVPVARLSSANSSTPGVMNIVDQTFSGLKTFQNAASFGNTFSVVGAVNALSTLGVTGAVNALSTLGVGGTLSAFGQLSVTGNATFNTTTLFVDAVSNRVGVGTITPGYPVDIVAGQATHLRITGGSTGYTQGALVFQSATTDSPQGRGLGTYYFNEGADVNWYAGTLYNAGDAFGIARKANSVFDVEAANVSRALFLVSNTGGVSIGVYAQTTFALTAGVYGSSIAGNRGIYAGTGVLGSSGGGYGTVGYNVRYTSTSGSYLYHISDIAALIDFNDGFTFKRAASGTAGNSITFSDFMRITNEGNVGIGTTSPVSGTGLRSLTINATAYPWLGLHIGGTSVAAFWATTEGSRVSASGVRDIRFETNDVERMRIHTGGNLLVGKTSPGSMSNLGSEMSVSGYGMFNINQATGLYVGRAGNDGTLVEFFQDTTQEGTISVSGTTVSYNGGHLARWSQTFNNERIDLWKGTVMSNLDQMAVWIDTDTGELQQNEQLNCMQISNIEGDPNVAGVFVNWDNDDDVSANDMNIAMTGDMIIRISKDVSVQRGDLLMSAGNGTAKPQGDDIVRSKTIAKVTSTHVVCVYDDGSYCVPCVVMAC